MKARRTMCNASSMYGLMCHLWIYMDLFNTLRPRQNGCHFPDDTFKRIFLNENVGISIKISLKFVLKGPINNIPALVQLMAWRQPGDKPLAEPMVIRLPTHICVTWPQWVEKNWMNIHLPLLCWMYYHILYWTMLKLDSSISKFFMQNAT